MTLGVPFADGSVSVNLYTYDDLTPTARASAVVDDALVVEDAGFDGVTVSEHHGGTPGYFPSPLSVATWILEQTERVFVGAMPIVTPLRSAAGLIEEVAWLAARHPHRLGVGVAPGYSHDDFELFDIPYDERIERFTASLHRVTDACGGDLDPDDALVADPAVAVLHDHPVPVVSAAGSVTAARRAASAGCGIVFGSHSTAEEVARITEAHRAAGGTGPVVLGRRIWVGPDVPAALARQFALYQRLGRGDAGWRADVQEQQVVAGDASEVVARLSDLLDATGATALSLRVHVPGESPEVVRAQLASIGADVLSPLRDRLHSAIR